MDRRQRKTRNAIFDAFISLLSKKNFSDITIGEIIELADVGRATFYAHFETKDYLLKNLCEELFGHIFHDDSDNSLFNYCNLGENENAFLHLFKHIKKNDNNLYRLLSSKNNELFFSYFKEGVTALVIKNLHLFKDKKPSIIPDNFWVNHISSVFIETLRWWINDDATLSPSIITEYFFLTV